MAKLVIDEEVANAWGRLTSDSSDVSWIAAGYPAAGNNLQISLRGEGSGGLPEFIAALPADDIVWGAFKVVAVDNRGNLVSRRPKFISVKYCPATGIAPMKRAKAGGHKGAIKAIFSSHIDIEVESAEELTEEAIIAKLRACGGAHQPTGYEFHSFSGAAEGRASSPVPVKSAAAAPAPVAAAPVVAAPAPVVEKAPETVFVAPAEVQAEVEAEKEEVVEAEVAAPAQEEEEEAAEPAADVAELAEATAELDVAEE